MQPFLLIFGILPRPTSINSTPVIVLITSIFNVFICLKSQQSKNQLNQWALKMLLSPLSSHGKNGRVKGCSG